MWACSQRVVEVEEVFGRFDKRDSIGLVSLREGYELGCLFLGRHYVHMTFAFALEECCLYGVCKAVVGFGFAIGYQSVDEQIDAISLFYKMCK
jgi:hypothetical protein